MSTPAKSDQRLLEQDFYRGLAVRQRLDAGPGVDFAPIEGNERRPWNPYWYVFETLCTRHVGPWQRLLDFGCGTGIAAVRLARLGYQVDGFDPSRENCQAATELSRKYDLGERCEFKPMPAEALEYKNKSFDIVAGFDILHQVDASLAIAEAHRVLKPNGFAIFKDRADFLPAVRRQFARVDVARFTLLSRIDRLIPNCSDSTRGKLQRLDHRVLQLCPPLAKLGDTVVMICQK